MTTPEYSGFAENCHDQFMQIAIAQAQKAFEKDEVPVGAVLVDIDGNILSADFNRTIDYHDPSAHAEILVLRAAGQKLKNYRFLNTTLYATIEPCIMCMGAIIHARVRRVVFGVEDLKWGGGGSLYHLESDNRLNHHPELVKGVCEFQCKQLMIEFFKKKRRNYNNER